MSLNSDQLGKKGEDRFSEICTDAKLVANRSTYDRTGWDFIVEFPYGPPVEQLSLDKRRSPISCHVQVKTMWDSSDTFRMRLSSAERLAKEPKPACVYVFKVNKNLEFVEASLIHILDDNLAAILKTLRREHAKGPEAEAKINKKYITFRVSRSGQSLSPTGDALRDALQIACGSDAASYMEKKRNQLEHLGFELRPFRAEAKLTVEGHEAFVEMFLGLRSAEIVEWKGSETRFGISLPLNDHRNSKGTLHIQPNPADQCVIAIRERPLSPPVLFEGEIFAPAIPNLSRDQLKFLVKSRLFRFLIDHKKLQFETDQAATQTASLKIEEWINFFKALIVFSGGTATVTINPKKNFVPITVPLETKPSFDPAEFVYLVQAFESAQKLVNLAGAIAPKVKLWDISERANHIIGLSELFSGTTGTSPIKFEVAWPDGVPLPEKLTIIFASYVPLADVTLVYYGIADMRPEAQAETVLWKSVTMEPREIAALNSFPAGYQEFVDRAKAKENLDTVMMAEVPDVQLGTP
jgi:hypothetical protein